ncbi:MAG: hypothetical protein AB4372_24630 [Xenococcus sp. (in: cyanobacteria)]
MSNNQIQVTLTLSSPDLENEQLQNAVQELQSEIQEVSGVIEAQLIPIEQAETNAKGIGGFLLGKLRALINRDNLLSFLRLLSDNLLGNTIEVEAKGNGKELKIKLSRPEDLEKVLPQVQDFLNN